MHMRLLLRGTGIGLVSATILILVAGCEEPLNPPPAAPKDPPHQTLYTKIGADEILERWSVIPSGAVAQRSDRQTLHAAATSGFSDLAGTFRFRDDARKYGACVVFTVEVVYKRIEDGLVYTPGHFIDCPGGPTEGNEVGGLFHAAHFCQFPVGSHKYFAAHVIRAGSFDPTTHVHPNPSSSDDAGDPFPAVQVSIGSYTGLFYWHPYVGLGVGDTRAEVYWAVSDLNPDDGKNMAGFDTLHRHEDDLQFSIDRSEGVVDVQENDGAAYTDYLSRCENETQWWWVEPPDS